jgi:Tfp pilus assembly protein PilF
MAGRKKILPQDPRIQVFLEALADGNYIKTACAYAGIGQSTAHMWMDKGSKARDKQDANEKLDAEDQRFLELLELIEKARAEAIQRNVKIIRQAGETGQWQASAWWLERTMPKEFGRQTRTEITGADGGAIQVSVESVNNRIAELLGEIVVADEVKELE